MKDWFGRFSYDINDNVSAYVQGSWAQATNISDWVNVTVSANASRPNTLFANNPFLAPATQTQLGAGLTCGTPGATGYRCLPASPPAAFQNGTRPPAPPSTPYFSATSYIWNNVGGRGRRSQSPHVPHRCAGSRPESGVRCHRITRGNLNWDLFYNFGESINKVINPNNTDNGKYLASLDAVIAPNGTTIPAPGGGTVNVSGTIVCWVTTQPAFRDLYPGCIPTNITDPNGPSIAAFNYLSSKTFWALEQHVDNVGGSIGGGMFGLGLPAGEIRANLSFDARWNTYDMRSNALPTDFVDCTGLRMCLANASAIGATGLSAPVKWVQNTNAPVSAKNDVWEVALEVNVPLLSGLPAVQDLSTNWAIRNTKYSSFGAVQTWKGGLNWAPIDSIRFRATVSRDIRAPNLNDLYEPLNISSTSFTDALTGNTPGATRLVGRGNADLTPEKARTVTAGIVLTPTFLPDFNFSVDYFRTKMTDAITRIRYDQFQSQCTSSAPSYNSPICALANRPIMDPTNAGYTLPANYPTEILNVGLNAAVLKTHGYDFQLNYGFDVSQLFSSLGGRVSFRHMATYQPPVETVSLPNTPVSYNLAAKLRQSTFLTYQNQGWTVALQNQWLGKVAVNTGPVIPAAPATGTTPAVAGSQIYAQPKLPRFNVLDATLSKRLGERGDGDTEIYLTVSNLLNERAPLFPAGTPACPNLTYPTLGFA